MRLIALAFASALGACSPVPAPEANAPAPVQPAEAPPPGPVSSAQQPADSATPAVDDACGAAERQGWIGRDRSALPSAPAGALWRIFETGQPVTQDRRANRLNIEIDPDSRKVVRLSCG